MSVKSNNAKGHALSHLRHIICIHNALRKFHFSRLAHVVSSKEAFHITLGKFILL